MPIVADMSLTGSCCPITVEYKAAVDHHHCVIHHHQFELAAGILPERVLQILPATLCRQNPALLSFLMSGSNTQRPPSLQLSKIDYTALLALAVTKIEFPRHPTNQVPG